MATVDMGRIIAYEKAGRLRVQKHPDLPLFIANYTERVQWERLWDDLTLMCRGLVFDDAGTIVARPLRKFFNLGEPSAPDTPDEPFTVTEKLDGSLGIVFYDTERGQWNLASRGSFTSEQADTGRRLLYDLMDDRSMDKKLTYCVEIVYPENRIVVNYGDERNLYVITAIDTETGEEREFEDFGFPRVRQYESTCSGCLGCIEDLLHQYEGEDNFEGFVVRYQSGLRFKVKLPEYLRLHRLVTGVNSRRIWECLSSGQSIEPFLERVPEEFAEWVIETRNRLEMEQASTTRAAVETFAACREAAKREVGAQDMEMAFALGIAREYRKAFAVQAMKHPTISGLLFTLLDGGDIRSPVWQMIRPEAETPFQPRDTTG